VTLTGPAGGSYADCGGGQVYNILPPGENGLVNAATAITRQPPPHGDDQRTMYADLVRVAPNLQPADLGRYFKQAGLSVGATDVERAYSPRPGTVVVRDKAFGVAHVFGATRADTEFGSGYAAAEDRLFMMDVFRHVGRSQLSSFLGPSQTALALDCEVARVAGYTDAERQAQIDALPRLYTQPFDATHSEGQQVVADGLAYVDGVNAYINQPSTRHSRRPRRPSSRPTSSPSPPSSRPSSPSAAAPRSIRRSSTAPWSSATARRRVGPSGATSAPRTTPARRSRSQTPSPTWPSRRTPIQTHWPCPSASRPPPCAMAGPCRPPTPASVSSR
jgi:hypothetical protein